MLSHEMWVTALQALDGIATQAGCEGCGFNTWRDSDATRNLIRQIESATMDEGMHGHQVWRITLWVGICVGRTYDVFDDESERWLIAMGALAMAVGSCDPALEPAYTDFRTRSNLVKLIEAEASARAANRAMPRVGMLELLLWLGIKIGDASITQGPRSPTQM